MDITKIKAFLLVGKYKSFSKVAKEFSYTPSALSHMANALEQELGLKLFNRTHNGVELTKEGNQLYDKFEDVLAAEERLLKAAEELAEKQGQTLRIGTYSSIARHILPEVLHSFRGAYPQVKPSVLVEDSTRQLLEDNTLDVIFTDIRSQDNAYAWIPIMEERFVVAAPAGLFGDKRVVTPEDLYPCVFVDRGESILQAYFDYSRFKERISVNSIENDTALSMVKEGMGFTVVPMLNMKTCPPGVSVLDLEPALTRTIGVQYKIAGVSITTQRFINHLKKRYS